MADRVWHYHCGNGHAVIIRVTLLCHVCTIVVACVWCSGDAITIGVGLYRKQYVRVSVCRAPFQVCGGGGGHAHYGVVVAPLLLRQYDCHIVYDSINTCTMIAHMLLTL